MIRCRNCGASAADAIANSVAQNGTVNTDAASDDEWEPAFDDSFEDDETELALPEVGNAVAVEEQPLPADVAAPPRTARRRWLILALAVGAVVAVGWMAVGALWTPHGRAAVFTGKADRLTTVTFDRDGRHVIAGAANGTVSKWEVPGGAPHSLKPLLEQSVLSLAVGPTDLIVAGGIDRKVVAWPRLGTAPDQTRTLGGFNAPVTAVALHPHKPLMAIGTADGQLFQFGGKKPRKGPAGHFGGVRALACSPSGNVLVSAGTDGVVLWRNAETLAIEKKSDAHAVEVGAIAFSADGRTLASGDWNGEIRVFDATGREVIHEFRQPDAVSGLAITGDRLITAGWDGRLRSWSLTAGRLEAEVDTGAPIHALAFSEKAGLIATVAGDSRVMLWKRSAF